MRFPNVGYLFTYIRLSLHYPTYYLNFYYPTNRTLPYNHGLPMHYPCRIIRGYLDVYNISLRMIPILKGELVDCRLLRLYSGRREIQVCILLHKVFMYTRPAALNCSV